jgi:RNA binding exosome subunit
MALDYRTRFSSAEISIIVHATENEQKILGSLCNIFSISVNRFSLTQSAGHWGNKILFLTARLGSSEANILFIKIISSLNSLEKNYLSNFYANYKDEKGNLYIRLDKQGICQGKVSLSEIDSIRFRFRPVKRFDFGKDAASNSRRPLSSRQ